MHGIVAATSDEKMPNWSSVAILSALICISPQSVNGFFDSGTTTVEAESGDTIPRQSFFRWQKVEWGLFASWFWLSSEDIWDSNNRRRLTVIAGVSIGFTCIGVASILNARTLITADNPFHEHVTQMRDLRIWALGRAGEFNTPYRYRVWRITRLYPRSLNPEHYHGPRGIHQPRHDVAIIHTLDKMYVYTARPWRYMYASRAILFDKHQTLSEYLWMGGSGFENRKHIIENYKITFYLININEVVDCSKYLPKWWGKFICIKHMTLAGIPSGGGLYDGYSIGAVACFEIRYNEDRILVFTDIRYYYGRIHSLAYIWSGMYYEYAYPHWSVKQGWMWDSMSNDPHIPGTYLTKMYPMGKK